MPPAQKERDAQKPDGLSLARLCCLNMHDSRCCNGANDESSKARAGDAAVLAELAMLGGKRSLR